MSFSSALTLVNPQNGHLTFKIFSFEDNSAFDHIQRANYYSLIWVRKGSGQVKADFAAYDFGENTLFAFSPYQPYMLSQDEIIEGYVIQFHPDFFCIYLHQKEVACNGVLFNNIYHPPHTAVDSETAVQLERMIGEMKTGIKQPDLAQYELLVSYLKIFLITVSRLKASQQPAVAIDLAGHKEPFILQSLKDAIESDFKTKHSARDYADTLNISAKALGKITKTHFNKTLTELIAERIIIEAKRELYLTSKPIKEIAYQLGYEDEYYFSRFFKTNTSISPQLYRDTVGFDAARKAAVGVP